MWLGWVAISGWAVDRQLQAWPAPMAEGRGHSKSMVGDEGMDEPERNSNRRRRPLQRTTQVVVDTS